MGTGARAAACALCLAAGIGGFSVHAAVADPGDCNGTITGGVINDSVHVRSGARCFLDGVRVSGDVVVDEGGFLVTRNGTVIDGAVVGDGASMQLVGTTVGGSVLALESSGLPSTNSAGQLIFTPTLICGSTVGGSIVVADAPQTRQNLTFLGGTICANQGRGNRVGGDLIYEDNQVNGTISDETVGGALVCDDNTPDPAGSNNVAAAKLGECQRL